MGDTAIRVEGLSKQYRIGGRQEGYRTLRDILADTAMAPFRRVSKLLRGQATGAAELDETIWALRDASFEVKQGEVVGIIGRNGAGKSTLLRILTRITEPTEGWAEVYGRIGSLLEVGTGFHPELTGRENIYLNGTILGMKKAEIDAKFDEIVAFSEVEKFIDTPVKHYSSGMYLRLAFAVAAHLEPEIMLVDEVLAVGDAAFQKKCLGKMGEVARGGRTVLFVSHNMAAVASLTQRSIWLERGNVVAIGNTQELIEAYLSEISSDFQQDGFASLTSLPRPAGTIVNQRACFEWVRTQDKSGKQKGVFARGEPIIVESGFKVHTEVSNLEFGIGVSSLRHNIELLFVPSPIYRLSLPAGCYSIQMNIDPNYLQAGSYALTLKMFADGIRQETIEALRFTMAENNSYHGEDGVYRRWIGGLLRLDYEWGQIESRSIAGYE